MVNSNFERFADTQAIDKDGITIETVHVIKGIVIELWL
jgi:hypothetical protein